jgi:hypothetical protein
MIPLTGICYMYEIKQKKASSGIQMENKNVSDDHLGPSSVHPIYIRPTLTADTYKNALQIWVSDYKNFLHPTTVLPPPSQ